jgi:hypothetical protein
MPETESLLSSQTHNHMKTLDEEFEDWIKRNKIQVDNGTIMKSLLKLAFEKGWEIGYRDGQNGVDY